MDSASIEREHAGTVFASWMRSAHVTVWRGPRSSAHSRTGVRSRGDLANGRDRGGGCLPVRATESLGRPATGLSPEVAERRSRHRHRLEAQAGETWVEQTGLGGAPPGPLRRQPKASPGRFPRPAGPTLYHHGGEYCPRRPRVPFRLPERVCGSAPRWRTWSRPR